MILGLSVVAAIGSYAYGLWLASRQEQKKLPRLALDPIVKALRGYHRQAAKFPQTFAELEGRVWHHKDLPNFGDDGRSLSAANYYYLYYQAGPSTCTIWAIPTGSRREEGSTIFVVLTPEAIRRWKGAPLSIEEIERLKPVPSPSELAVLGLIEQPPLHFKRRSAGQRGPPAKP